MSTTVTRSLSLPIYLPQSPPENSALLCPVELVWVNYTIVELEVLVNASQVSLHPSQSSFTISPITPGTSYTVNVSFVNEVGESLNNPSGEDTLCGYDFCSLFSCFFVQCTWSAVQQLISCFLCSCSIKFYCSCFYLQVFILYCNCSCNYCSCYLLSPSRTGRCPYLSEFPTAEAFKSWIHYRGLPECVLCQIKRTPTQQCCY